MKKFVSVLLALLMLLSLVACGGEPAGSGSGSGVPDVDPNDARYGGSLDICYTLQLGKTLDPLHTTGWKMYIWTNYVFENVVARGADGSYQPGVCDFELSDDMLTLKLWVKEGKTFHNGDPVTIDDVVASIDRFMYSTLVKNFNDYIESVEVADGVATYKFREFNLLTMEYFTRNQSWAVVMPKEICEKYGENPVVDVADCIGTGPYKVTEFTPDVKVVMERYEDYIPVENDAGGLADAKYAYMDKITVWLNTDSNSSTMALLNGEYDVALIPQEFDETAKGYGMEKFTFYAGVSDQYLAFNTKGNRPVAKDVNLRKAIVAALDLEDCLSVESAASGAMGYTLNACPMAENTVYYSDEFNQPDYMGAANVELAKQYLEAANYNGEEIVLLVNTGSTFKIDIVAESYLRAAGINVTLKYVDGGSAADFYKNVDEYDMIFLTSSLNQFSPATLTADQRSTFWGNEQKDQLFTDLGKVPANSDESLALWEDLKDLWIDECATIMLGYFAEGWTANGDLVVNQDEAALWTTFVNAYWKNPDQHN